jgi:hypothetical protein
VPQQVARGGFRGNIPRTDSSIAARLALEHVAEHSLSTHVAGVQ